MTNPFENIDNAFMPFYDEVVEIKAKRKDGNLNQTLKCVVFSAEFDDPISDETLATERKTIKLSFSENDWQYIQKIQVGDKLYRQKNNTIYNVSKVAYDEGTGYNIFAKEK